MDKTIDRILILTVGCMLLLSTTAQRVIAWPCKPPGVPCDDCYTCTPTGCEWDCSTGATCCNGSCCNSGNCCNSTTCCSNSDDVCCTDSGSYCCESGKTCCKGTCCDPNYTCCDGTCCNTSTQKCCDDIGGVNDGYCCYPNDICCKGNCCDPNLCLDCNSTTGQCESICDPNSEFCCDGTCCKNYQCCIDGNCVDPICNNCHPVGYSLWECGHGPNDVNCQSDYCILNSYSGSSCDYMGPDWPCLKKHCDTAPDNDLKACEQMVLHTSDCPTGGDPVIYTDEWWIYHGCGDYCAGRAWQGACIIDRCYGDIWFFKYTGQKYKCGCP